MSNPAFEIFSILKKSIHHHDSFTPLHIPEFNECEIELVTECIESNFVSSVGQFVDRFEKLLIEFTGAKYCVLCVNGTSALHLALHVSEVSPGDEVLIPSFTFVATANAVSYCGGIPHFVEIEDSHLGIDPVKLRDYLEKDFERTEEGLTNLKTGQRVKALVPMHAFGHPCAMADLSEIAADFQLLLIEDAAESLGSYIGTQHTGNHGLCGILSFNGNKIITTGGGGAILTNDAEFANRAKHLSTTAKMSHSWDIKHDYMGFNYRMPALNAALGCAQMAKLSDLLGCKRVLAQRYEDQFKGMDGVRFVSEREGTKSNYWLNTLILEDDSGKALGELLKITNEQGIMTRPAWTPMHMLPMYSQCPRMEMSTTESMARRVINIPSSSNLGRVSQ
jgi:perosamine synthetase